MVDIGINLPLNDVVAGDYKTERLAIGANAALAKMLPGAVMTRDTNDHDVMECDAAEDIAGFLGYGMAHSAYKPATRDTAYTALADEVPVHKGVGFLIRCPCASTSFVKDDLVTNGASGVVIAATLGTDDPVGRVAKSTTTDTTVWIWSLI
jgi:hypothetical protein